MDLNFHLDKHNDIVHSLMKASIFNLNDYHAFSVSAEYHMLLTNFNTVLSPG
jgi:hypothetical protein